MVRCQGDQVESENSKDWLMALSKAKEPLVLPANTAFYAGVDWLAISWLMVEIFPEKQQIRLKKQIQRNKGFFLLMKMLKSHPIWLKILDQSFRDFDL